MIRVLLVLMLSLLPWLGMDAEAIAQSPEPEQEENIDPEQKSEQKEDPVPHRGSGRRRFWHEGVDPSWGYHIRVLESMCQCENGSCDKYQQKLGEIKVYRDLIKSTLSSYSGSTFPPVIAKMLGLDLFSG